MSPNTTGGRPSRETSKAEQPALTIHLFPCGHGDTVLIQYGENGWSLIDCFLPARDGTRARFFDFVSKKKKIQRLDFVFQTHPDYDHYHGMIEVIRHFTSAGRSIGMYLDTGLNPRDIRGVFQHPAAQREYEELQNHLRELHLAKVLVCGSLHAQFPALSPRGRQGAVDFLPVGPDTMFQRNYLAGAIGRHARNPATRIDVNPLSLVLALECNLEGKRFAALLAGDTDPDGMATALDLWTDRARQRHHGDAFDVVKVSHHGSIASHHEPLCARINRQQPPRVAAISCGTRAALPDREVIRQFQAGGWQVLATTTRRAAGAPAARRRDLPMQLADRSPPAPPAVKTQHVKISWSPNPDLKASPRHAVIRKGDLVHFDTAQ
jgi:beta-lactamase superfamily II metal-dependent hydrolase